MLSTAEIIALLPGQKFTVTEMYKHALIVDAAPESELDHAGLMSRLGGTVKIGHIIAENMPVESGAFRDLVLEHLSGRVTDIGNATFGYSIYSLEAKKPASKAAVTALKFRGVGMEVKRKLKTAGCAARWVRPKMGAAITSVSVAKNKLLVDGAEFVVLAKEDGMFVGKTDVVQPFEEFSETDYGRPERDPLQGMLPPKLARIMINLIHVSKAVMEISLYDPFCGSGTILTEALRLGFDKLYGSDLNPKAVENTKKNMRWICKRSPSSCRTDHSQMFVSDSRKVGDHLGPDEIDAIVTEPYLGPPMKGTERPEELQKNLRELTRLYKESLRAWKPVMKDGSPVVMALPVYIKGLKKYGINAKEFEGLGFRTESLLPSFILSRIGVRETANKGLLYGRNDQHVWREIVRLREG